ncbi:hypothetical protein NK6_9120 [Bradyrhizobium diazoefficiens]|uniref:Uncharacterized protein n=1 Tax=Bradyrhizobium diazoefficiens TaxID=1355477 RepID=A0A0E4BX90_9BRAD|nr:hypothetical protein NK6_9120 [Bradyrhizobium diazoefficiens]
MGGGAGAIGWHGGFRPRFGWPAGKWKPPQAFPAG